MNLTPVLRRSLVLLLCALVTSCGSDVPFYRVQVDVADTVSIAPGESTPVEITLTRTSETPGDIRLTLTNAPEGVTLSPEVILPAAEESITSTPTLAVAANTPAEPGLYRTQLLAEDAANDRAAGALFFIVLLPAAAPQPDFSISVEPRQLDLFAGQSAQVTVTVTRAPGFTGAVTVTLDAPTTRVRSEPTTLAADQTSRPVIIFTDRSITRVPVATTLVATSEDGRIATTGFTVNVR
jgi:hypothetical protein